VTLRDTAPEIRSRQLDVYRAMRPERRVEVAMAMSEDVRHIALDGIRARNPDYDEVQVHHAWLRMLHGDVLAGRLARLRTAR
jgi:hypothetical protein